MLIPTDMPSCSRSQSKLLTRLVRPVSRHHFSHRLLHFDFRIGVSRLDCEPVDFHLVLVEFGFCVEPLHDQTKYDESLKETLAYLQAIYDGKPGYLKSFLPRVFTTLGDIYLAQKDYDKAVEYFSKAAATLKEDPARHPARWAVWGLAELGNAYDLKGMRPKALEIYREAKSYKDEWGLAESIERFQKKPFAEDALPVPIPPP